MSGSHHAPAEGSTESHPVRLAIMIALGTLSVIIGIILLAQYAIGSYGARAREGDPAMSAEAIAARIAPVARVEVDPNAAPPQPAAAPAASAPVSAPVLPPAAPAQVSAAGGGKATYDATCAVCHGTGVAGAPKFGDKAAWAPRLKTGIAALHAASLKGKGAMPPKGGNTALSDDAVKAAVDHMVAAAR